MAIRRLAARLRHHDWLSAVIELVIVVVGILLALQVSNWNQDRVDRARGDNYVHRVQVDLLADQDNVERTLLFWKKVSAYGEAAITFGERGQRVDDSNWKTVLAYYQASQIKPFQLEDTAYREMRDTGDLALIGDVHLRRSLSIYYLLSGGGISANILNHDPEYRMQVRGLTPWHVQQYIWAKCFRPMRRNDQDLIDCPSPISEDEAGTILDTYRASESLLVNLRSWMATLGVSAIVIDSARKDSLDLSAGLAKGSGGTPVGDATLAPGN